MTKDEILGNLCYYDVRNPYCVLDHNDPIPFDRSERCYCDNCYRGKTKLAEYILYLLEVIPNPEALYEKI